MTALRSLFCVSFSFLAFSCASKQKNTKATDSTQGTSQNATQSASCLTDAASVLRTLGLSLSDGAATTSLCDLANRMDASNNAPVIVFLTTPTCTTCKPIMKQINTYVAQQSSTAKSTMYVGVPATNQTGLAYTIADARNIIANPEVVPTSGTVNSVPVIDVNGAVWSNATVGSLKKVFPHVIIFNRTGKFRVFPEADLVTPNFIPNTLIPALSSL